MNICYTFNLYNAPKQSIIVFVSRLLGAVLFVRAKLSFYGGNAHMKKMLAVVLVMLFVLGSFAGCGSDSAETEDAKVIKIGVFEPVTGENGGGGFQEVLGVRYANTFFFNV